MTPVTPTSSSSINTNKPTTSSAVRDFHKGTKRDMNLFPTLRDPAKWDSFEREFEAVACSQNLHKVLDEKYKPKSAEEKELFTEMQAFFLCCIC